MKKILHIVVILVSFISLTSCEDLIEIEVPEGDKKLVVEGILFDIDSSHVITLSTTAAYFDKSSTPRFTGAVVFLSSSDGDNIYFVERSKPGDYEADFIIQDSIEYTLNIVSASGREYQSHTEELLRVPPLEVYQNDEFLDSIGDFRKEGYYVSFRTQEPEGLGDFYRWIVFINGEKQIGAEFLWVEDDRLIDGNVIEEFPQFFIYGMYPGDSVEIRQTSISERAFHYWILIQEQLFNQGSPFSTPPASIEGNINSITDPNEVVLGLFSISRLEKDQLTVKAK